MTTAEKYAEAINKLITEITKVSIDQQTIAQRDCFDDQCTRRYTFADGSVFTEAVDECCSVHYGVERDDGDFDLE